MMKKVILTCLVGVLTATASLAQEANQVKLSDGELQQFAKAFVMVQTVNQQTQQKMAAKVEENGMDVMRYNELQKASQNPNADLEASKEEMADFNATVEDLQAIQMKAQQKMQQTIENDTELTIQEYQEIMAMVQKDPELQSKLQQYMGQ